VVSTTSSLFQRVVDPANRANPYPLYAELRRTPVSLQDDGTYVISTFRETGQLLRDPRISHEQRNLAEPPRAPRRSIARGNPPFINQDPPAHDRARRLVMRQFGPPHTPGRVEGMRARIDGLVTDFIDSQAGRSQIDIVERLAFPLPVAVICDLLGVPIADADRLSACSSALVSRLDPASVSAATDEQVRQVDQAEAEFADYMGALLAERHKHPGDDLLSGLIIADDPAYRLSDDEAISTAVLLMIAGHETTVNLIANGVLTFLRYPEVLERLRREPELMIGAIEELLRYEPPVQFTDRTTLTDLEVAGVDIPKGAPLIM
jgi:cytochrome P450